MDAILSVNLDLRQNSFSVKKQGCSVYFHSLILELLVLLLAIINKCRPIDHSRPTNMVTLHSALTEDGAEHVLKTSSLRTYFLNPFTQTVLQGSMM